MEANDMILYAQWQENEKPVPPTPDPKPRGNTIGQLSHGVLPKTGEHDILLISLLTLGSGLVICTRVLKKK